MDKKREYLREGMINEVGGNGLLQASACRNCRKTYFPGRETCPECGCTEFDGVALPDEGSLYTYTEVRMPSAHYKPPYVIGWVEFPNGIRVFGLIDPPGNSELKIGMKMKPVVSVLWEEEEKEVVAYRFVSLG